MWSDTSLWGHIHMFKSSQYLFWGWLCFTLSASGNLNAATKGAEHRDTLNQYCVTCHNETLKTARLQLDHLDPENVTKNTAQWEKVLRKLRNRQMPPAGMPRPDEQTYDGLITYLTTELDRSAEMNPDPGRPALHRLNRSEYANAVRDLLAIEIDSTALLPADDIGYGFDNIGDVLTVSPFLMERYLGAAAKISRLAIGDTSLLPTYKTYELSRSLVQFDRMGKDMPYGSRGGLTVRHHFPVDAEYLIKVKLQTGRFDQILGLDKDRELDIRLDNKQLKRFTISPSSRSGKSAEIHGEETVADDHLEIRIPIKAGTRTVTATFIKDKIKTEGILARPGLGLRNRESAFFEGVGDLSIAGPYNIEGPGTTPSREKIFSCRPSNTLSDEACARQIIENLTHLAYRRPVTDEDLTEFLDLYQQGNSEGGFETGIRMAVQMILVSPEFLFRMEFDPSDVTPGEAYPISNLDLATRLSFFLWSSIPDEELLSLAEQGRLKDPAILNQQIKRMMLDPRSQSLVTNFAGQWLFLRNMEQVLPDPLAFPDFDINLQQALQKETELLIESMLHEDRSIVDLLDSDYTFVNERLARHYDIEGIYGSEYQRINITDERRKGLLGQGSILTVTSYPNRTAPTIRGKWVLEQLLGTPPPPPPPNVPTLKEDTSNKILSMRERMEKHRANPACAACHKVTDPLGFALENFDGLGRWRETSGVGTGPIDASGILPDGTSFDGPVGLRNVLLSKKELFIDTFTERLLTYALGRGVEYYDLPTVRKIRNDAADQNYRWSSIISGIVSSVPCQMRRASKP
jgi:mono/diheme cytochrome c family protein